jgi:hypothetical protein
VIHYQDGNALADAKTRFLVTMLMAPGMPMLMFVDDEELTQRARLRATAPDRVTALRQEVYRVLVEFWSKSRPAYPLCPAT